MKVIDVSAQTNINSCHNTRIERLSQIEAGWVYVRARNPSILVPSDVCSVDNQAESQLGEEDILAMINRLPDTFRRALLLYFRGNKYREIALADRRADWDC